MVCDPITGTCRPRNPLIDGPVAPEPPAPPKPEQPQPPVNPEPPVNPPSGGTCNNPCPSQANPNNCCGPTQGCYQGTCTNYSGCSTCTKDQICVPIERAPYYGCKDKGTVEAPKV